MPRKYNKKPSKCLLDQSGVGIATDLSDVFENVGPNGEPPKNIRYIDRHEVREVLSEDGTFSARRFPGCE